MDTILLIALASFLGFVLFRFIIMLRRAEKYSQHQKQAQKEKEEFLATFGDTPFNDFSSLEFKIGQYSHCHPFPRKNHDGWVYTLYFTRRDAEDVATIVHEITEWTIGRVIEKLLNLKKPLYLQRKQENNFWISGKKQKYVLEHVITTLSELDATAKEKLTERLAAEDIKTWLHIQNT
ncbi:MAG: hypothetical protein QW821_01550 [Candidatus Bathyarchaeia archaeon]